MIYRNTENSKKAKKSDKWGYITNRMLFCVESICKMKEQNMYEL